MKKEFKGLLKSEVNKIERAANKISGFSDCKCTGYSAETTRPFDFDQDAVFVEVYAEVCRNYEEVVNCVIHLTIPMSDRRRSYISCAEML